MVCNRRTAKRLVGPPGQPVVGYSRQGDLDAPLDSIRWAIVVSAFCFFGLFGFADEAKKNYRLLASTLAKSLGYTAFTERAATSGPGVDVSLHFSPRTFVTQQTESRGASRFVLG
ncbi:hypothetical protein BJ322DRAFT_1051608 [Thelephora terrestris]|uniref:Uncharacterized protein n=1 Tax=Thelephora terrestris TaxID=56493 RepID=A0A9P6HGD3_9AGAM|nr:hypothetical protein BJ322DRAFT_1051608 [Thelephora terrestris]